MKTDLNYIKKLIKLIETGDVNEIEIEEEGTKLRVVKTRKQETPAPQIISYAPPQMQMPAAQQTSDHTQHKTEEKKDAKALAAENLLEVKSPIVGTFYRAPSPTADPYIQVGSVVEKGGILCIIEAMKLMNEIESEVSGKVVKILVENGQPVEYNQALFLIDPKG
jgi:acetyl-CoA carboxylase biotin carboxyl carrier protein